MGLAAPAMAEQGAASAVQITPYVWLSGFGGTIQPFPGAPQFRASKSFGELLKDVDAALFVSGLVRIDRFVAVTDLTHSSASKEGLVPTGNPAAPFLPAEGRLRQTSWTLAGGYRVIDDPSVTVDLLGGLRAWWLRARVEVPLAGVARAPNADFVDPMVMGRVNWRLAPNVSLLVVGDVGGLGIGSEFTGQALATLNARVAEGVWLSGGYRHLAVDRRDGGTRIDAALSGPILGATVTF
jgi:hypothetical protein